MRPKPGHRAEAERLLYEAAKSVRGALPGWELTDRLTATAHVHALLDLADAVRAGAPPRAETAGEGRWGLVGLVQAPAGAWPPPDPRHRTDTEDR